MSKREKLPKPWGKQWNWLAAARDLAASGSEFIMPGVIDYLNGEGWRIGKHRHDPDATDREWAQDFTFAVLDALIEQSLTRFPE
jgi:hypothetical protein